MDSTRREFLKTTVSGVVGASALGASALNAWGAPFAWTQDKTFVASTRPTLVVIYLRGGADPLNTIIPYRDKDYHAVRPTIGIRAAGDPALEEGQQGCIPIDKNFGLHPSLAPIAPLYEQGHLAPIVCVGSRHETRSHFDAQDFMEWAAPGIKSIQEGWLNRYLQATATPDDHFLRAFSPQPLLPRSLRGQYSVLAAPGPGSSGALDAFEDLYGPCDEEKERQAREANARKASGGKSGKKASSPPVTEDDLTPRLRAAGLDTVTKLRQLNKILSGPRGEKRGYPRGALGLQMSDIASVLRAGVPLEIAAVDYGGWDHHSYQGGSQGQQARMLFQLSQSIATFVKELGPDRMKRTLILTMTEFGRTVRENGSQGSDHGHGGFMLAAGGGIQGGKVFGRWTGLQPGRLYQKRDLPVYTDFRDVFAETLRGLFRFDFAEHDFFPEYKALRKPLRLFPKA